jgi:hypothetical protein
MIAAVFLGNVSVPETLFKKGFIVHEGLLGECEIESGNPDGLFSLRDCDNPRTLPPQYVINHNRSPLLKCYPSLFVKYPGGYGGAQLPFNNKLRV